MFFSLQRVLAAIQIASQDFANELMQFNFSLALNVVHFFADFIFGDVVLDKAITTACRRFVFSIESERCCH